MKKTLISILIIMLMSMTMIGSVYAAQLETTIDITANITEVSPGDNVVFTFALKDIANAKDGLIGAIEGVVTYDTNFYDLVTGVTNTSFSAGGNSGEKFNVLCGDAKEGDTIAIFTLKVKDNPTGSGTVKFTELAASDGDIDRGDEAIAKTKDKEIEIKLKSEQKDNIAVTGITITPISQTVEVGKSTTFIATITPENATNKKVLWSSSDETIATVTEDGIVTGIKNGIATITAITVDGDKTGTATIEVKESEILEEPEDTSSTPITEETTTAGGENEDTTIADTIIPKAGKNAMILITAIVISLIALVIYIKNQKFKDIK